MKAILAVLSSRSTNYIHYQKHKPSGRKALSISRIAVRKQSKEKNRHIDEARDEGNTCRIVKSLNKVYMPILPLDLMREAFLPLSHSYALTKLVRIPLSFLGGSIPFSLPACMHSISHTRLRAALRNVIRPSLSSSTS